MPSVVALALLVTATIVSGLLAGGNLDRAVIAMPAWRRIGPVAWAEFSRRADLASGLFLYPAEAIGGFALILGAFAAAVVEHGFLDHAVLPLALAAIFAAGGLAFTVKAAPSCWASASKPIPFGLPRPSPAFTFG